jgi:hypothetical protein
VVKIWVWETVVTVGTAVGTAVGGRGRLLAWGDVLGGAKGGAQLVRDYYGRANKSLTRTGPSAPLAGSYLALALSSAPRALPLTVVRLYYAPKQSPLRLRYYPSYCYGLTAYINRTTVRTVAVVRAVAHAGATYSASVVDVVTSFSLHDL